MIDSNGKWPTDIHEHLIDKAFPGLSAKQIYDLKYASFWMDHCATCQLNYNSYQHKMKAPGESNEKAKQDANKFISDQETKAKNDIKGPSRQLSDINDNSMVDFGKAGHTVLDGSSPAHVDADGNPREWNVFDYPGIQAHEAEEGWSALTPERETAAIDALRQAFANTYGADLLQQAITPPPTPPPAQTQGTTQQNQPH